MSAENEALVRRFFDDFCSGRQRDLAYELISADYVSRGPQAPPAPGPDEVIDRVAIYQATLDGRWTIDRCSLRAIAW